MVVRHKHGGRAAAYVFCGGWVAICSGLLLFAATAGDTYIAELNAQQNDSVRLRALLLLAGGLLGLQPVRLIVRLVTACTAVFLIGLTFAVVHLRTGDAHIRETAYWRVGHIVVGFLVSLAASRSPLFAPLVSISELLEGSAAEVNERTEALARRFGGEPPSSSDSSSPQLERTGAAAGRPALAVRRAAQPCATAAQPELTPEAFLAGGCDGRGGSLGCSTASTGSTGGAPRKVRFGGLEALEDDRRAKRESHAAALDALVAGSVEQLRQAEGETAAGPAAVAAAGGGGGRKKRPPALIALAGGGAAAGSGASGGASGGAGGASGEALPREVAELERAFAADALSPLLCARRVASAQLQLGAVLGCGAFGTVYVGTWRGEDALTPAGEGGASGGGDAPAAPVCAVKLIHRHHLTPPQVETFKRALEEELKLAPHPNVCRIHAWACDAAAPRLLVVSELCAGGSLAAALEAELVGAWAWPVRLQLARGLAAGMAFLHAHEPPVIHRDLKPDNLLLELDATSSHPRSCKICDLGASRREDLSATMTDSVGTPIFRAPEQLSHQRYSAAVDVWAGGCVLVCLALGSKLPYEEAQRDDGLLRAIVSGETTPALPPGCAFAAAVRGCCQLVPHDRLNAAQLVAELAALKL